MRVCRCVCELLADRLAIVAIAMLAPTSPSSPVWLLLSERRLYGPLELSPEIGLCLRIWAGCRQLDQRAPAGKLAESLLSVRQVVLIFPAEKSMASNVTGKKPAGLQLIAADCARSRIGLPQVFAQ